VKRTKIDPPRLTPREAAIAEPRRASAPPKPRTAGAAAPSAPERWQSRQPGGVASVRSLERALDLLETLERLRSPAGARALEASTQIPKATVQRLLDVLERRGYVQKDQGRYALAVGTVRLARGFLAGDSLATIALPIMQRLTALSGETCSLYVRQGGDRIIVQKVESPNPLRHHTAIGERLPLHIGASGHVLCAGMPDGLLHHYVDGLGPVRLASGRALGKKELWARIRQARLQGYAVGIDERFVGVSSVAAPVSQQRRGVVAAINIAGPSSRLPAATLDALSLELRSAAQEISEKLDRL
jgi:DNA-binding IclR family transcriptional regulator